MAKRLYVEWQALRPFKNRDYRPVVISARDYGGNAAGEITYEYRELIVRLETEKFYAVADVAWAREPSKPWRYYDIIRTLIASSPDSVTPWELGASLVANYDAILGLLMAPEGRRRLDATVAARSAEEAEEWARATDTSPAAELDRARRHEVWLGGYRRRQRAALVWKVPLYVVFWAVALGLGWVFFAHSG